MLVIGHYDSAGNIWRFKMDCNRRQAAIMARFLRVLRNMGVKELSKRQARGNKETDSAAGVRVFCATLEQDILTALYAKYPATENDYYNHEFFIL